MAWANSQSIRNGVALAIIFEPGISVAKVLSNGIVTTHEQLNAIGKIFIAIIEVGFGICQTEHIILNGNNVPIRTAPTGWLVAVKWMTSIIATDTLPTIRRTAHAHIVLDGISTIICITVSEIHLHSRCVGAYTYSCSPSVTLGEELLRWCIIEVIVVILWTCGECSRLRIWSLTYAINEDYIIVDRQVKLIKFAFLEGEVCSLFTCTIIIYNVG